VLTGSVRYPVIHWVSFVRGTPLNYTDPSGHSYCDSPNADPDDCTGDDSGSNGTTTTTDDDQSDDTLGTDLSEDDNTTLTPCTFSSSNTSPCVYAWANFTQEELINIGNWLSGLNGGELIAGILLALLPGGLPGGIWMAEEAWAIDSVVDFFYEAAAHVGPGETIAITVIGREDSVYLPTLHYEGGESDTVVMGPIVNLVVNGIILYNQIEQNLNVQDAPPYP
jgi:hypothetical protein